MEGGVYLKFLVIDGNSVLNRAFYGVRLLTNSSGFPTNAIYGFYNMTEKFLKEEEPTHVLVAFDLKEKTFRHKKFKNYKANRKKMPQELFLQLVEVKKMLALMGVCVCEEAGFEADDLIGTISRICTEQQVACTIASGDRDVLQLVNKYVTVRLLTSKGDVLFDEAGIFNKFGISAKQLIEVKALMGDSSDNITGVKGIGEKTAIKLISQFENVSNIFTNLENLNLTPRVKTILSGSNAKEMCFLSKELGTICLFATINENLDVYLKQAVDFKGLKSFFEKFELKKFLKNLNQSSNHNISTLSTFKAEEEFEQGKQFHLLIDADLKLVKQKLQTAPFLNFFFYDDLLFIVENFEIFKFSNSLKLEAFKVLIAQSEKPKRTTNLKQVHKFCFMNGLEIKNVVFSCDIASYLINVLEKGHDLSSLAEKYFNCNDVAKVFVELCERLQKELLENNLNFLFSSVELPLTRVLAEMEICGFEVDEFKLASFGELLIKKIASIKTEIFNFCGRQFNLNSIKELGHVLFNELNLPKTRKTKTGYSTDAESLATLEKHSEVVKLILEYRELTKLHSTYVVGLQKVIGVDGRIHSSFNQTQTRTGRISSLEPNIQNIPIKTELGSEMRKFFVAKKGYILIDGDYSQIELRILAEMANDEKMIEAFKKGLDVHNLTASKLFGVDENNVSAELRSRAKTVNFSVIYGISAFSLAKDLRVSVAVAQQYIDSFFEGYDKIKNYFDQVVETAKTTGAVKTMFGRIRKIPELSSRFKKTVALGERIAKNTPIQGTCADLIKIAMINLRDRFKKEQLDAQIVLQVHDELLVEASESCAQAAALILKQEMENVTKLKVPLEVEVRVGKTWFDC